VSQLEKIRDLCEEADLPVMAVLAEILIARGIPPLDVRRFYEQMGPHQLHALVVGPVIDRLEDMAKSYEAHGVAIEALQYALDNDYEYLSEETVKRWERALAELTETKKKED